MLKVTISQLAQWCSGRLIKTAEWKTITEIVTDSRSAREGCAFVALRGERFDGHQFVADAILRGAKTVIVQQIDAIPKDADVNVILVEDTLKALGSIAHSYFEHVAEMSKPKVVAVTGSCGKTTTKLMVSAMLSSSFNVLTSPESYNNEVGIPLTLFQLAPEHQIVVLEYAARHEGDIAYLCRIAKPHIGIITNVGKAHLGIFGSQEAIERAKGELIEAVGEDGYAILNADDPTFERMKRRTSATVLSFSMRDERCHAFASDVRCELLGVAFDASVFGRKFAVRLPMLGIHNVSNALAAMLAVHSVKGEIDEEDVRALESFEPPKMRMQPRQRSNGVVIINDAYNANPESMRAALQALRLRSDANRRIAVLGEMRELGEASYEEHFKLGWELVDYDVDVVVVVGGGAAPIAEGAISRLKDSQLKRHMEVIAVSDVDEAVNALFRLLKSGDVVLVKASRAVELDRVVNMLLGEQ
ncbi:MAG: UDP-N-acetylmuramoyl-tripeptide--D-alanyl-D-alanine ligase [Armatimonadota bacterium]|nr:UDP-N-acetylmuramoyl-tripeptide--D-alanyl-D-alanine ligase [Armatimonadota bacterium]MCX7777579.1 UDP-N-acetylmuramoyl-tripeptide--D-alanyl-D-alanine ligase [Armatimonadota bacterium]MDW8025588.1 UDP-N-acetylmuramoyl-tripeptide--D-alanyl-D-alanine ligase [Armatimonadota bacterium]